MIEQVWAYCWYCKGKQWFIRFSQNEMFRCQVCDRQK